LLWSRRHKMRPGLCAKCAISSGLIVTHTNAGSHFASKPSGACSRKARAKIFTAGEIPVARQTVSLSLWFRFARAVQIEICSFGARAKAGSHTPPEDRDALLGKTFAKVFPTTLSKAFAQGK